MSIDFKDIRRKIIDICYKCKAGHIASTLSMVEYLTILFLEFFKVGKTKIIFSKPHGSLVTYIALARLGYIKEKELYTYTLTNSRLTACTGLGFKDYNKIGITFVTDVLAHGLAVACGVALTTKEIVYVSVGDGELQSGHCWEAILLAGSKKLKNIILTVDNNQLQCLDYTAKISSVSPLKEKFESFGWRSFEIDGHNPKDIRKTFKEVFKLKTSIPTVVICNTLKGKGISFIEKNIDRHFKCLTEEEYLKAMKELK